MKYQLSINIGKSSDKNSASTKAVKDCVQLFSSLGYKDHNLYYAENLSGFLRYLSILRKLISFYSSLKPRSIIGVQYPMLNNVFKYFIKVARLKKIKFFCIIHDIESLRLGGLDEVLVRREVENLNYYDCIIAHNDLMIKWLLSKGLTSKVVSLGVFDYLLKNVPAKNSIGNFSKKIVYAGNLAKSGFIYSLSAIPNWHFNVYGPNLVASKLQSTNVSWQGEYTPEQVVYELEGDFGLIWDGDKIEECDLILGNYLKYNNPHKFSLYLAAGLPVIAPRTSAIGKLILDNQLGVLVNSLGDLDNLTISQDEYKTYKQNTEAIRDKVIKGEFFLKAVEAAETFVK